MPNYLEIESVSTVPTNGTIKTYIYEDSTGDGTADKTLTTTFESGTGKSVVGPLDLDKGNDLWFKSQFTNPNETINTVLDSVSFVEQDVKGVSITAREESIGVSSKEENIGLSTNQERIDISIIGGN